MFTHMRIVRDVCCLSFGTASSVASVVDTRSMLEVLGSVGSFTFLSGVSNRAQDWEISNGLVAEEHSSHLVAPEGHQTSLTRQQLGANVGLDLATVVATTHTSV